MAFTFLVEDGTGLAAATSYVSVEDADDIIAVNIHADAKWVDLALADKEKLLSWASRYLDNHVRWKGCKTVEASALRWPRKGVVDRDGQLIPEDVIPQQLKIAVASFATYLIDTDRSTERPQDGLAMIKVDVIELEFREGYKLPKIPSHMGHLLEGLGTVKSNRIGFARIIR